MKRMVAETDFSEFLHYYVAKYFEGTLSGGSAQRQLAIQAKLTRIPVAQGIMTVTEDLETLDTKFARYHLQPPSEKPN